MKSLTIIFATTALFSSCLQKDSYGCESQLTSSGESQYVFQPTTKTNADRKCVKSKKGLTIMYPKIN